MTSPNNTFWQNHLAIKKAAQYIRNGGVIAYPTEAVWGLGCDPFDESAVNRLLRLKQRPVEKGVILVAAHIDQLRFILTDLNKKQIKQLKKSWPSHTTWVVPNNGSIPPWITGAHDTIALRVSTHPVVHALCHSIDGPLVSTSANPAGKAPVKAGWQVRRYFQSNPLLDFIVPGCVGGQEKPSRIKDIETGKTLR